MRTLTKLVPLMAALALLLVPGGAAAKSRDRDHDKLPDKWEKRHHLSTKKKSARKDGDRDGLNNLCEYRSKTKPRRADSDHDGRPDGDEDPDRDSVDNRNECREKTKPRRRDTDRDHKADGREDRDRDGLSNANEDRTGNDPIDQDTDNDGVKDGDEHAGVVTSYANGVVTIALARGGSLSGRVDSDTDIWCETERQAENAQSGRGGAKLAAVEPDEAEEDEPDDAGGDDDGEEAEEPAVENDDPTTDEGDDSGAPDPGSCVRSLKPGAVVHSARLQPNGVFDEIALVVQPATG
jgi:hypothetical protein